MIRCAEVLLAHCPIDLCSQFPVGDLFGQAKHRNAFILALRPAVDHPPDVGLTFDGLPLWTARVSAGVVVAADDYEPDRNHSRVSVVNVSQSQQLLLLAKLFEPSG